MEAFVNDYFSVFNDHDAKKLSSYYAETARLEFPEEPYLKVGPAAIEEHYLGLFEEIPDVKDEVKTIVAGKDKVAVEFVSKGTDPSGATFQLKVVTIFEFSGDKVVRDVTYYDTGSI